MDGVRPHGDEDTLSTFSVANLAITSSIRHTMSTYGVQCHGSEISRPNGGKLQNNSWNISNRYPNSYYHFENAKPATSQAGQCSGCTYLYLVKPKKND